MYQNRVLLENTLRDKVRTGEDAKIEQLELMPSARTLEEVDEGSKQLHNYSQQKRIETLGSTKNGSQHSLANKPSLRFNLRKASEGDRSLVIIENQLAPQTSAKLKKKFLFKPEGLNQKAKLKSQHRYKNSTSIDSYQKPTEQNRLHNVSMQTPKIRNLDDDKQLRRYAEVNASVNEHLRKFEYLIPDLRKKKFDLMKEILGDRTFEEIQYKLNQK
jgi:hypothetical protein